MNLSQFFIDESVKQYIRDRAAIGVEDVNLNLNQIAKRTGSAPATIWRQLNKRTKIQAETWIKLMTSLGNFSIDVDGCIIIIRVSNTPENKRLLKQIKTCDFRSDYELD